MEETLAIQTVALQALRAVEVTVGVSLVVNEGELAVWSRAPRDVGLLFKKVLELELLELLVQRVLKQVLDVQLIDQLATAGLRAADWELAVVDV